jgi:hypothetical protein
VKSLMMRNDDMINLMRESIEGLSSSGIVETPFELAEETVIFGSDSPLDSISFVTFITDMEERLGLLTGKDISITLLDIDDFNESDPHLTVKRLADFLVRLSAV